MESKYLFRRVSFLDLLWRALPLIEAHTAMHGSDLATYLKNPQEWAEHDAKGNLILAEAVDARTDATVGYVIWGIAGHPLLPGALCAKLGPYYVDQRHRKQVSRKLFEHSLDLLRQRGLRWALPTLPIRDKRKRELLTVFGRPIETTFLLDLEEVEAKRNASREDGAAEQEQPPVRAYQREEDPRDRAEQNANQHLFLLSRQRTLTQPAQEVNT